MMAAFWDALADGEDCAICSREAQELAEKSPQRCRLHGFFPSQILDQRQKSVVSRKISKINLAYLSLWNQITRLYSGGEVKHPIPKIKTEKPSVFARRLVQLRRERLLTQAKLAEALGMSRPQLPTTKPSRGIRD